MYVTQLLLVKRNKRKRNSKMQITHRELIIVRLSIYFSAVNAFYTRALLPTRIETNQHEKGKACWSWLNQRLNRLKKRRKLSNWVSNNKQRKLIKLTDFYTYNRTKSYKIENITVIRNENALPSPTQTLVGRLNKNTKWSLTYFQKDCFETNFQIFDMQKHFKSQQISVKRQGNLLNMNKTRPIFTQIQPPS